MSDLRADAFAAMTDMAAFVETVRQSLVLADKVSATAAAAIAALASNIESYAHGSGSAGPGAFVIGMLNVLDDIMVGADPDTAAATMVDAASAAVANVPAGLVAQLDQDQAGAAIWVATAVAGSMQAIRMVATATYTDRPAAIAARTTIQGIAELVLPVLGVLGDDATGAFTDLWGAALDQLTVVILDLAPIALYQTNQSLPSCILAYRLYGDPSRAAQLVALNKVGTPLLMPLIFEAPTK